MGDPMLFTPVASWYYKTTGEKFHWLLTTRFELYKKLEVLLRYQDFTSDITYFDYPMQHENPNFRSLTASDFGLSGDSINLCFALQTKSGKPLDDPPPVDRHITDHWAIMFEWGVDKDFVLKYPKIECPSYENVWIEAAPYKDTFKLIQKIVPRGSIELKESDSIELKINLSMNAKNVWTSGGGWAAMMDLCGRDVIIYQYKWEYPLADVRAYRRKHKYIFIDQ